MIRFGVVETDEEIVYENNQCKLKINQREFLRGKLLMTSRFVCFAISRAAGGSINYFVLLVTSASNKTIQTMDFRYRGLRSPFRQSHQIRSDAFTS